MTANWYETEKPLGAFATMLHELTSPCAVETLDEELLLFAEK
jgi:hypothetical protein